MGMGARGFVIVGALLLTALIPAQAGAYELKGLPGSTWGSASYDADNGISGAGVMGWVNQGIDWTTLPGDWTLNTFAEYRYRSRAHNRLYYDSEGPAVGVELKRTYYRLGADYYRERLTALKRDSDNREFYFSWYYWWDLKKGGDGVLKGVVGLPGSTWGNLTYDVNGINGSGAMGWVNQGIDWTTLPGGAVFNTFAEYRYRSRTENKTYYDAQGPAIGAEVKWSYFRFGADYYWERYASLGQSSNKFQYYATWFYSWDLLQKPGK